MTERLPPTVFVHVHYADVWAEMAAEIAASFDRPFALVLTCRDERMELAEPQTPHLVSVRRIVVENRGRDVLPFMQAMREAGESFEIGLKLHTKRSIHREDGEDWRRFMLASLLEKDERGLLAPALMESEPRIGLILPEAHLLPLGNRMVMNVAVTRRLVAALGYEMTIERLKAGRFAAGSMFWFRREALERFARPGLGDLFARERGQLDGTAAHAAERVFAAVAEEEGYVATAMEAVAPLRTRLAQPGPPASLDDLQAISELALSASHNPFSLPLSAFWERHPHLLVVAHHAYRHTPPAIWRLARRIVRRATGRSGRFTA